MKKITKTGQKNTDWTFEDLKNKIQNEAPIVDNEDGTFTLFKDGGNDIVIGKREDFTYGE